MIRVHLYLLLALSISLPGMAQNADDPDVVHVPLSNPGKPARLEAETMNGSLHIRGADVKDVVVEAHGGRTHINHNRRDDDPKAAGLKRLETPGTGLNIREEDNVVRIRNGSFFQNAEITVTVPRRSSLQLKCLSNGDLSVSGVEGEMEVENLNGDIELKNVAGAVLAHSLNGAINATLTRTDISKAMSFSTLNGEIDVALPPETRANLRIKTDNGEIFSDFDVKMNSDHSSEVQKTPGHAFRYESSIQGAINGGGPELKFTSFNGRIYIRKKK